MQPEKVVNAVEGESQLGAGSRGDCVADEARTRALLHASIRGRWRRGNGHQSQALQQKDGALRGPRQMSWQPSPWQF